MSSNSVRISAQLFEQARQQGELMSRSTAQQVEHWARLGARLEAAGLPVAELAELLRGADTVSTSVREGTETALWAHKRAQQARDLQRVRSGRATNDQMSWFSGGRAKTAKLKNSPY